MSKFWVFLTAQVTVMKYSPVIIFFYLLSLDIQYDNMIIGSRSALSYHGPGNEQFLLLQNTPMREHVDKQVQKSNRC